MKYRGCRGIALQETYIKIIVMEYTDILVKLLPSGELKKASKRCYNKALKRSTNSFINTTKTFKACFGRIFHIQQEAHMNEVLTRVKRRTKEKNDREELEEKLEKKSEIVRRREKAITMTIEKFVKIHSRVFEEEVKKYLLMIDSMRCSCATKLSSKDTLENEKQPL
ncbi:hypothetical protein EIN_443750 [Entamoeba invadens IP1]|uniref:Uncharacterized protein n=1 Tax=Entamoeba invadens IP1 TaxID=370355 RepID=A0A0A1UB95_ENTIV|nr:hypothetical protein EIN_443750 [Entamoeba invadens IP1]ELP92385.1 hypothetical protein EIN_443750 [Entamoeba invadens IP1]|eukprot:XP_004259156.1 hypothetical protein EIN_443750 [Entamoeba invadens IP1]